VDNGSNSAATWSAADRVAYRQFVRTHHPDIGGDPAIFIAGVQRFHTTGRTESSAHSGNADPYGGPLFFVARPQGFRAFLQAMLRRRRRQRRRRVL